MAVEVGAVDSALHAQKTQLASDSTSARCDSSQWVEGAWLRVRGAWLRHSQRRHHVTVSPLPLHSYRALHHWAAHAKSWTGWSAARHQLSLEFVAESAASPRVARLQPDCSWSHRDVGLSLTGCENQKLTWL